MTLAPPRPGARVKIRGVIGESAPREDAAPKVKGEFQYASDLWREGMLHGATLRSPHPFARVKRSRSAPGPSHARIQNGRSSSHFMTLVEPHASFASSTSAVAASVSFMCVGARPTEPGSS